MVIKTGLSGFQKMSVTVTKMYYNMRKVYRRSKNFTDNTFINSVKISLSKLPSEQNVRFKTLIESVNVTLDKHAQLKKDKLKELISSLS